MMRYSAKSLCYCVPLLVMLSCGKESDKFIPVTLIEGAVTMKVPPEWPRREMPYARCSDIGEACYGSRPDQERGVSGLFMDGFTVRMYRKEPRQIADCYAGQLAELKAKNRAPIIINTVLDKQANSLTVDYTGRFYDEAPPFFFRNLLIVHGDEWVQFYFRGADTPALRKHIEQVSQTVTVHSIKTMKRQAPCREFII